MFPDMVSHSLLAIRQGPERPIGIVTLDVSFSASQSHHYPYAGKSHYAMGATVLVIFRQTTYAYTA